MLLTQPQSQIFLDPSRFRVIVAGRRFGKTHLATVELMRAALSGKSKNCWYVAPTYKMAKEIAWDMLGQMIPSGYIDKKNETNLTINLLNGSTISLKGGENPDSLRGRALDFVIMDEFADMKPTAWTEVLRPSISDREGSAMWIGTPKGRNHFYDLWTRGVDGAADWHSFQFTTLDGGNVSAEEIEAAKRDLDERTFSQEYWRLSSITQASSITTSIVSSLWLLIVVPTFLIFTLALISTLILCLPLLLFVKGRRSASLMRS